MCKTLPTLVYLLSFIEICLNCNSCIDQLKGVWQQTVKVFLRDLVLTKPRIDEPFFNVSLPNRHKCFRTGGILYSECRSCRICIEIFPGFLVCDSTMKQFFTLFFAILQMLIISSSLILVIRSRRECVNIYVYFMKHEKHLKLLSLKL